MLDGRDSIDAVRRFGEASDVAVVDPQARAVLSDFDSTVKHYRIVVAPDGPE